MDPFGARSSGWLWVPFVEVVGPPFCPFFSQSPGLVLLMLPARVSSSKRPLC